MTAAVAITGVGAVTPLGLGAGALIDRWCAGECGVRDGVGACSDFDPPALLGRKDARRTDRFSQLAMVASDEALAHAGWDSGLPYDAERVGCVIGTGIGGIGTIEREFRVLNERGPRAVSPLSVPLLMPNAGAAAVALRHGLRGPSEGVVSACAAGAHAIGTAMRMIQSGEADAVVTGGAEAPLVSLTITAFGAMGATSRLGVSRPFDARRDGFVLAEGAGVLVLESAELARRRGARILGEILGYAATGDASHLTAPDPQGRGAARALRLALEDAGVQPDEVDYVNAHGTSTPLNDRAETMALKTVFGERARSVPVSSTKSAIGHLLGAAGAVEAVATVLALGRRQAPPTVGYGEVEDGLDLDYVPDAAKPLASANGRAIGLSNSFGFGGHNAVLCLAA